jgi:acetyl/propionyl-CoA carboxylase alpha subunit
MKKVFEWNRKKISYLEQRIGQVQWIYVNGKTIQVDLSLHGSRSRKSSITKSQNLLHAPMPGKITKILVEVGQNINVGDSVLVMEAMKMEYTLKSEIQSTVIFLKAEVGSQVKLGQLLVELQKESK